MKSKKFILLMLLLVTSVFYVKAQSYETNEKWEKSEGTCIAIQVNTTEAEAINALAEVFKSDKLSGKKSSKTLKYEKIVFTNFSTDYINIYVNAKLTNKDKNNPVTTVYVFISKGVGSDFVSSASDRDLISNVRSYMDTKYMEQIKKNIVNAKITDQNKLIKETEKRISTLEKEIDKKNKEIKNYEKSIEKNKKEISDANSELSNKRSLLKQQQDQLKGIK